MESASPAPPDLAEVNGSIAPVVADSPEPELVRSLRPRAQVIEIDSDDEDDDEGEDDVVIVSSNGGPPLRRAPLRIARLTSQGASGGAEASGSGAQASGSGAGNGVGRAEQGPPKRRRRGSSADVQIIEDAGARRPWRASNVIDRGGRNPRMVPGVAPFVPAPVPAAPRVQPRLRGDYRVQSPVPAQRGHGLQLPQQPEQPWFDPPIGFLRNVMQHVPGMAPNRDRPIRRHAPAPAPAPVPAPVRAAFQRDNAYEMLLAQLYPGGGPPAAEIGGPVWHGGGYDQLLELFQEYDRHDEARYAAYDQGGLQGLMPVAGGAAGDARRRQKKATDYNIKLSHPDPPIPTFTRKIADPDAASSKSSASAKKFPICASCLAPLLLDQSGLRRLWALKCGHVACGECIGLAKMRCEVLKAKESGERWEQDVPRNCERLDLTKPMDGECEGADDEVVATRVTRARSKGKGKEVAPRSVSGGVKQGWTCCPVIGCSGAGTDLLAAAESETAAWEVYI